MEETYKKKFNVQKQGVLLHALELSSPAIKQMLYDFDIHSYNMKLMTPEMWQEWRDKYITPWPVQRDVERLDKITLPFLDMHDYDDMPYWMAKDKMPYIPIKEQGSPNF